MDIFRDNIKGLIITAVLIIPAMILLRYFHGHGSVQPRPGDLKDAVASSAVDNHAAFHAKKGYRKRKKSGTLNVPAFPGGDNADLSMDSKEAAVTAAGNAGPSPAGDIPTGGALSGSPFIAYNRSLNPNAYSGQISPGGAAAPVPGNGQPGTGSGSQPSAGSNQNNGTSASSSSGDDDGEPVKTLRHHHKHHRHHRRDRDDERNERNARARSCGEDCRVRSLAKATGLSREEIEEMRESGLGWKAVSHELHSESFLTHTPHASARSSDRTAAAQTGRAIGRLEESELNRGSINLAFAINHHRD